LGGMICGEKAFGGVFVKTCRSATGGKDAEWTQGLARLFLGGKAPEEIPQRRGGERGKNHPLQKDGHNGREKQSGTKRGSGKERVGSKKKNFRRPQIVKKKGNGRGGGPRGKGENKNSGRAIFLKSPVPGRMQGRVTGGDQHR